ncbi:hypothetical protein F2Q69_00053039 [Brassica cretica]|uniref:Uncharacterized protein n=1 Tax=Brassica cretica TaxID=69181 RepID=A0A8S9N6L9_BRACR|nr:hypothetical protein F2Q69_00053039 [Brassica cretica]
MVTTGSFLPCCEFEPRWRKLPHDVSGHHTDMGICFKVALNEKNDKPTSTFEFQLMLGTASPWLGQSLFVFDFVFLVVGLPSIVSARFGFQDLVFGVLTSMLSFIARGRLHSFLISLRLPFPLYSCISLQLSSHLWWLSLSPCLPLEIWIMFSFVYAMWAWEVISGLKFSL